MTSSYSLPLVALSIMLAATMSFAAVRLARAQLARPTQTNAVWAAATALVLGTGIWAMHFVGMLAFQLPVPIGYDFTTTLASWAAAVLVCWLGLTFVLVPAPTASGVVLGAIFMGSGIAVMHYSGMAAMEMSPPIQYRPVLAALSVIIGIGASYAALRVLIGLRTRTQTFAKDVTAAILMGIAVSGLHYVAMAASVFAPYCVSRAANGFERQQFIFELVITVLAVLGAALGAALFQTRKEARFRAIEQEQRLSATTSRLAESEQRFKAVQEVAVDPFFILTAETNGAAIADFRFSYVNPAALRLWRLREADLIGHSFLKQFPTTMATGLFDVYASVMTSGEAAIVEQEYIGEGLSGWFRISCVKLFDGVAILFSDITDRRRDEQALRTSREELRRLSAHVQHVREEEKARIARELHDDLGQQLTALKMAASQLENVACSDRPWPPHEALNGIYAMIDDLVKSIRHIAADLHPVMLEDLGLIPAIDHLLDDFSARYRIRAIRHIDQDAIDFNRRCRNDIFRIVQEALTNVARHSGATEVVVAIARDDPHCIVRIADNGRGVQHEGPKQSFGLLGMRERATLLGGEIRISTEPGAGLILTAILPLSSIETNDVTKFGTQHSSTALRNSVDAEGGG
ncbi:MHYT domain-containing protein [Trinickia sp. NRRL B-1857]|uniref:MHYT domain-containing protein n=1 Tax=Trinickia sp. NRRL B-1857 TaxID=3162879 RepID=UPI003D2AB0B0